MFVAHVIESVNDAALEKAVIAFGKVCVNDHTAHERLAVVHHMMAVKMPIQALV